MGGDALPRAQLTQQFGLRYVALTEPCAQADIISIHTP